MICSFYRLTAVFDATKPRKILREEDIVTASLGTANSKSNNRDPNRRKAKYMRRVPGDEEICWQLAGAQSRCRAKWEELRTSWCQTVMDEAIFITPDDAVRHDCESRWTKAKEMAKFLVTRMPAGWRRIIHVTNNLNSGGWLGTLRCDNRNLPRRKLLSSLELYLLHI